MVQETWAVPTLPRAGGWASLQFTDGRFFALARGSTLQDGVTWVQITLAEKSNWNGIACGEGVFAKVCLYKETVATSQDGVSWYEEKLPFSLPWSSIAYGNGSFVIVATKGSVVATSSDRVTCKESQIPKSRKSAPVTYGNDVFVAIAGWGTANEADFPEAQLSLLAVASG
jgi:hypothetical protein